eukprot:scaffold1166_cov261-Pinguiococcus_pyrenoidosus.AAC.40
MGRGWTSRSTRTQSGVAEDPPRRIRPPEKTPRQRVSHQNARDAKPLASQRVEASLAKMLEQCAGKPRTACLWIYVRKERADSFGVVGVIHVVLAQVIQQQEQPCIAVGHEAKTANAKIAEPTRRSEAHAFVAFDGLHVFEREAIVEDGEELPVQRTAVREVNVSGLIISARGFRCVFA